MVRAAGVAVDLLILSDVEVLGAAVGVLRVIRAGDGRHGQLHPGLAFAAAAASAGLVLLDATART